MVNILSFILTMKRGDSKEQCAQFQAHRHNTFSHKSKSPNMINSDTLVWNYYGVEIHTF